jgi:hypothetical protein
VKRIFYLKTSELVTKQAIFQLHETVLAERILDIDQSVGK